jgi:type II secretory ATPase GspE/PulE/Tfp pilus assembly ATPase PilB-like protein
MAEIIETNWIRPVRDDLVQFLKEEMNRNGGAMEPHNTEAWADALLRDALNSRASDIHLAPQSDGVQLRLPSDPGTYRRARDSGESCGARLSTAVRRRVVEGGQRDYQHGRIAHAWKLLRAPAKDARR